MRQFLFAILLVLQPLAVAKPAPELIEKVKGGKEQAYPTSVRSWPCWVSGLKWNKEVEKEIRKVARGILSSEQLKELDLFTHENLSKGTCVGQSFIFLTAHPPSKRTLQSTITKKQLNQILFFQYGEYVRHLSI